VLAVDVRLATIIAHPGSTVCEGPAAVAPDPTVSLVADDGQPDLLGLGSLKGFLETSQPGLHSTLSIMKAHSSEPVAISLTSTPYLFSHSLNALASCSSESG
jgi:hypothetical protein